MTFATRLERARRRANLTVAELARWLGRPDATVRCWVNGTAPGGPPLDVEHVEALLGLLETLTARRRLPAPRLGRVERAEWLAKLRKACVGEDA